MADSKAESTHIEKLQQKLWYLKENYGIAGVKGGTEAEDMSFHELRILREISSNILPMTVKIGGAEARNDIRECIRLKADIILAPMIESYYAFANFHTAVRSLADCTETKLGINIETLTAYSNINQIISHEGFEDITQVTVGRSDLATSMDCAINAPEVTEVLCDIVKRMKQQDKQTSVGGEITPLSAQVIIDKADPHYINTRHIVIDISRVRNLTFSVCEALALEIELYKCFIDVDSGKYLKTDSYLKRIEITKQRMTQRNISAIPTLKV